MCSCKRAQQSPTGEAGECEGRCELVPAGDPISVSLSHLFSSSLSSSQRLGHITTPLSPAKSLLMSSSQRVVPLTELAETSQILLSNKPRLINVTHQIPYTCTLIDRTAPGHTAGAGSGTSSGQGSPPVNRRPSYIPSRHVHDSSSDSGPASGTAHPDGDCILEQRRGHSAMYSGIISLSQDWKIIQIGWVGELADQDGYVVPSKNLSESHRQALKEKLWQQEKVVPIFLDDNRAAGHYEGYCKGGK